MSTSGSIGGPGGPQQRNDNIGIVPVSAGSVPDPKESVEIGGDTGIVPPWLQNPAPNAVGHHHTTHGPIPTANPVPNPVIHHPINPAPNPVVTHPINPAPNPDSPLGDGPPPIIRNPAPNHHNPSIPPEGSTVLEG